MKATSTPERRHPIPPTTLQTRPNMAPAYIKVPPREEESGRRSTSSGLIVPNTAHMATTTLQVGGMTCGACTSAVESGFKGVEGVGNVSVSLVMERAVVLHDPQHISAEQIQQIIEDRGFDAEVLATDLPSPILNRHAVDEAAFNDDDDDEDMMSTTIAIEGMTSYHFFLNALSSSTTLLF
ncbi:Copper-transporting ATPase ccc2 like protein [Verticillium longisporum]|nr:Copper-transporting ATPase ccc2 like protein [Verticillium longisporum]